MNVRDIESILEGYEDEYGDCGWSTWFYELDDKTIHIEDLGQVEVIETVGGHEGAGDHVHMVFEVTNPEGVRYFKKYGYYASFNGTDFDGSFDEVKPIEKTITVYE